MRPIRVRAPREDGGLLAQPPLAEVAPLVSENRKLLATWHHDFQGRDAERLRAMARAQVIDAALAYHREFGLPTDGLVADPRGMVMTGHQPELYHPGVWVKNFALAGIARRSGAQALKIVVDDDIPKAAGIRVPLRIGDRLSTTTVDFDLKAGDAPYEDWACADEPTFRSFGTRVRSTLGRLVPDPVIDAFWPEAVAASASTDRIGTRFAVARRRLEDAWGVHNLEVPWSRVCETEAFGWFTAHLLAHLPRFHEVHNRSLVAYRALYGIRSKNHPVPELKVDGCWREAPFWVWRVDEPRRRPLQVCQIDPQTLQLRIAGESDPFLELPLGPDRDACCASQSIAALGASRIRLRTRALTTTLFSRLLIGDLFLHGIGGAKYDELGDEIIRGFYGLEPPRFATLSQTLFLGLEERPGSPGRLHAIDRRLREMTYNPDRLLDASDSEVRPLVEAKAAALAGPVETRAQRVARYHELRRIGAALSPRFDRERHALERERLQVLDDLAQNSLARGRAFPFVLHSATRLRRAFSAVVEAT